MRRRGQSGEDYKCQTCTLLQSFKLMNDVLRQSIAFRNLGGSQATVYQFVKQHV